MEVWKEEEEEEEAEEDGQGEATAATLTCQAATLTHIEAPRALLSQLLVLGFDEAAIQGAYNALGFADDLEQIASYILDMAARDTRRESESESERLGTRESKEQGPPRETESEGANRKLANRVLDAEEAAAREERGGEARGEVERLGMEAAASELPAQDQPPPPLYYAATALPQSLPPSLDVQQPWQIDDAQHQPPPALPQSLPSPPDGLVARLVRLARSRV